MQDSISSPKQEWMNYLNNKVFFQWNKHFVFNHKFSYNYLPTGFTWLKIHKGNFFLFFTLMKRQAKADGNGQEEVGKYTYVQIWSVSTAQTISSKASILDEVDVADDLKQIG